MRQNRRSAGGLDVRVRRAIDHVVRRTTAEALEGRVLLAGDPINLVADLNPGATGSAPARLIDVNGTLYFTADNGQTGGELYKASPGAAPTLVKDVRPGAVSAFDTSVAGGGDGASGGMGALNGVAYFAANDGAGLGMELWRSDGTAAGTVLLRDINPGAGNSNPRSFAVYNNELYFVASDGTRGSELWKTNGTAAGTVLVKDIAPGGASSIFSPLTVGHNGIYFTAADVVDDRELWYSNGTDLGTGKIDVRPGSLGSYPREIIARDANSIAFVANGTADGASLYVLFDPGNVVPWMALQAGSGNTTEYGLSSVNLGATWGNTLYFSAVRPETGRELWHLSNTGSIYQVADLNPGAGSSTVSRAIALNGAAYFTASTPAAGTQVYTHTPVNGPGQTAPRLTQLPAGAHTVGNLTAFNNALLFTATSDAAGAEVWRSDGKTVGGEQLLQDLNPGPAGSGPARLTPSGNRLYLTADNGQTGGELFVHSSGQAPISAPSRPGGVVPEGARVSFSPTTATYDPDGTIVRYEWDWDYDPANPAAFDANLTTATPTTMALPSGLTDGPGTHTIALRVTDNDGLTTIGTSTFSVGNLNPRATFPIPAAAVEGSPITVTLINPADPSADDVAAGLLYSFDFNNDGDFTDAGDVSLSASPTATFTFADEGGYQVRARITDKDGGFAQYTNLANVTNAPPRIDSVTVPSGAAEWTTVTLRATASDPGVNDVLTYAWTVRAAGQPDLFQSSTNPELTFTLPDSGRYDVWLTVSDGDGQSVETFREFTAANLAPTAGGLVARTGPDGADEGQPVTFDLLDPADAPGDVARGLRYDFDSNGDGGFDVFGSTSPTATWATGYDGPATVLVTARVRDPDGASNSYTTTVTVRNLPPVVSVDAPGTAAEGALVRARASATDPGSDFASQYDWRVTRDGDVVATGSGVEFAFTPADQGSYVLDVTARDEDGGVGTGSATVAVTNVAPTATLFAPNPVAEGEPFGRVEFIGADDAGPADRAAGFRYSYDFDNDGSFEIVNAADRVVGVPAAFVPDGPATVTVAGRITDKDGASNDYTVDLQVTNTAPRAAFTVAGDRVEGSPLTFTGAGSDPSAADAASLAYAWEVRTGTPDGAVAATGAGDAFVFVPPDNGRYWVRVTATDKDGGSGAWAEPVNVDNAPPVAALSGGPDGAVAEGTPVTLLASATDAGAADAAAGLRLFWAVRRGGAVFASGSSPEISFTPDDDGAYAVSVYAADKDGYASPTVTRTVTATNAAPTAAFAAAAGATEGKPAAVGFTGATDAGADSAAGLRYSFDFNNDGDFTDAGDVGNAASPTAAYAFADDGAYTVRGRVADKDGAYTDYTTTVAVANAAPTAKVTGPATGKKNRPLSFTFAVAGDSSAVDLASNYTYQIDWEGDGVVDYVTTGPAGGVTLSRTYRSRGDYNVTVLVTDKDGGTSEAASLLVQVA